jgi:tetratricopeptide (TPR) repeat protein
MFRKLAGNFKRFGRISAGTKISDRETENLKLALMGVRGGAATPAYKGFLEKSPLVRFEPEALKSFFDLCKKLLTIEDTRLLFTSREALPGPFDAKFQRVTLSRLDKKDAIELVHQAMTAAGLTPKEDDRGGTHPEVEALVEAVNCNARSLVLLAPYISEFGVRQTTENLGRLMAKLHQQYPDERERSLFASVELSLRRLSPEIREKIKPLDVFQGGGHISKIAYVLKLNEEERDLLVRELLQIGLAELMPYNFLRFHPALCLSLQQELEDSEITEITARWARSMRQLIDFLHYHLTKNAQLALDLTILELPNLVRLLEYVRMQNKPEETVEIATNIEQLISYLGRPNLLSQVESIRKREANKLGNWNHARFESSRMQIERLLGSGDFSMALKEVKMLLGRCLQAVEGAYIGADYDTANAYFMLGRIQRKRRAAEAALQPIDEAYRRFQQLADQGNNRAARMTALSFEEKGHCLLYLGRYEEAVSAYSEVVTISQKLKDGREVAVAKAQIGTVRMFQRRYDEAFKVYNEALKLFTELGEPATIAGAWHQIGIVHEQSNRFEEAEQAYQQALAIFVQQNNRVGEASSLNQLGVLYDRMNCLEESVTFHKKAADINFIIKNQVGEGDSRCNHAISLIKLRRYDEARQEILRAIECYKPYGHAAEPWKTWNILCEIEQAEGNPEAAAQAREQAIQLYLAYRRDGGENHEPGGRMCAWFEKELQNQEPEEIKKQLAGYENDPKILPSLKPLIPKLQAILDGSRDPGLAVDPELGVSNAAEILLILEKL